MESTKSKTIVIAIFLMLASAENGYSQTFAEFFSQKKTQKKYLLQQIAALQIYAGYLKKGYGMASTGLETVRGFTRGEFDLHKGFISSLKMASPVIRNNSKVVEIISLQLEIKSIFKGMKSNPMLTAGDLAYIAEVREKVLEECSVDIDELLLVVTSGKIEMGDDERLERLEKVYLSMQDRSAFTQSFYGSVASLACQREQQHKEIKNIRRYYEIN